MDLISRRFDYTKAELDETTIERDPVLQFGQWMREALNSQMIEPNAMSLATVDRDGHPNCRIVLLRDFGHKGFIFFTNYHSSKGDEISANRSVALAFYWPELERQVRIRGSVEKVSQEDSVDYFNSRPYLSRLAAVASPQSQVIPSRQWLELRMKELEAQYLEPVNVPKPPDWGGYRVLPELFEFWQGRPNRLHDRIQYERQASGSWRIERLAP